MKKIQQVMENNKMMSLYDYLGRPAGRDLGLEVSKTAIALNIKISEKQVTNSKYSGRIMMYPKLFLDAYFKKLNKIKS